MHALGRMLTRLVPARLSHAWHRLLLNRIYRTCLLMVLPVVLTVGIAAAWFSDEANMKLSKAVLENSLGAFVHDEKFKVTGLEIETSSPELRTHIESWLAAGTMASPFDIDPETMKAGLEELPGVRGASVTIIPGSRVQVSISEREPVARLRVGDTIFPIDSSGMQQMAFGDVKSHADLPLIAGLGAGRKVQEALEIHEAVRLIRSSVRGLERIGERRWDLRLDGGRTIKLPARDPVAALMQLIRFDNASQLLARDVQVVDLRVPPQITVRLSSGQDGDLPTQQVPN